MWAAGKALEEAAGAVPWEGDWETIASIQETVCHSGAQVERVGQEDEIQLLWAWAHGITTEFLPWNRCLTLRNGWEEHLSGFSEPPTCPGCKVWGYISSRYMEGWRPQYRGWWDYVWDTPLSPLCERKTNAGGSNETGALEAGVALKGAVLPLKTSPGLNQCLLLFFFFSLFMCPLWILLQHKWGASRLEAAVLVRKRRDYFQGIVILHGMKHALPPSPLMQKVLEMASVTQTSRLQLKGQRTRLWPHCRSVVWCGDHAPEGWMWLLASVLAPGSADPGCPMSSFGWEWASL